MNVTFGDCIVRRTIRGSDHCAWGTADAASWPGPIYEYIFYLCKHKTSGRYYLFFTYDHFEQGQWIETTEEGCIPITKQLATIISGDELVTKDEVKLEKVLETFQEVAARIESVLSSSPHYSDLRNDLQEMNACVSNGSYRAALSMAGRILETCLKVKLENMGRTVQKDWMVGKLLAEIESAGGYLDPALKNIWNIINQQRIVGVHARELVPIPSKNQACMVAYAVMDVLDRLTQ